MRATLGVIALSTVVFVSACKGGIESPDEYRKATAGVTSQLKKLDSLTRQVRTAGDPQRVNDGLGKVLPAAKALHGTLTGLEVSSPSLASVHGALLFAVEDHVAALTEVASKAQAMPIPESKQVVNDSAAALEEAVLTWQEALEAM